jgi:protein SCO1
VHKIWRRNTAIKTTLLTVASLLCISLLGCGSQSPAPASSESQAQSQTQSKERRFQLKGTVVAVDPAQKQVTVNHEAIPGFMGAMTMPYPLLEAKTLSQLNPGDQITADVVVTDDGVHLENVVVVKKSDGKSPTGGQLQKQPVSGDEVPDFALLNQDGKLGSLRQYRGKALLVTFIYTRCPLPEYCPLMTHNFAEIEKSLSKTPALYAKTHLLCISFDPKFDTPAVLRNYARGYVPDTGKQTFAHWEFASISEAQKKDVLKFFNIFYMEDSGQISHSMRTAIISPDGKIYRWYGDSTWKPADLVDDVTGLIAGQPS